MSRCGAVGHDGGRIPAVADGVGWSALLVAAARAVESDRADGLVDDPWAARFVEAARTEPPLPTRSGARWPDRERHGDARTAVDEFWASFVTVQGLRSRVIDDALARAVAGGVTQVVILGAGLDARAYRLDWPAGTTVYEIDRPGIGAYKDWVLAAYGAQPRARRHRVPVDLADDWPGALRGSGFRPGLPSAWVVEGLLPFLPPAVERELLRDLTALAGPGSSVVVEDFAAVVRAMRRDRAVARFGDPFGVDMRALPDPDLERVPPEDQLTARGWALETATAVELSATYGRPVRPTSTGLALDTRLLTGRR
jgi:methyltransferase (TIGR00027 family)